MSKPSLLQSLINASEKASNIARKCRSHEQLLALLVQEKKGDEANSRFEHDFKTLADVLIQEAIKNDVGKLFPEICRDAIQGEESPNFTNTSGVSVSIKVGETETETAECLTMVFNENREAAEVLASEVHRDVVYATFSEIPELPTDLDHANLGIWIDPIDATAEYISGESVFTNFPGITSTGLDCVTVLIGVYERTTGQPVMGVVSQPFHNKVADNLYESEIFWGVALPQLQAHNCQRESPQRPSRLAIFSSSEHSDILQRIVELGYELVFSAGAGHKALKVISQDVDVYLLSKGSTFMWDTCAPQAILRALGGDIYDFRKSIKQCKPVPLNYLEKSGNKDWKSNKGGLIAVRDSNLLDTLLDKLKFSE